MIRAVLFDMDGVLIEAKEWHYEALNQALALFGLEISRQDHLARYDGLPTREKLRLLSLTEGLPTQLHSFINEMKQRYTMTIVNANCRPRFNHEYALSRLKAKGYRMGVCSNSIRSTVEAMMSLSALDQYLDFVVSNEDVTKSKPDPEMYTFAIAKLGLQPSDCLIVEDNEHGIRAARASGAHVMEVVEVDDVNWSNIARVIAQHDGERL
jgi:beta-phosphoglucomutase